MLRNPVALRFAGIGGQGNILMGIILANSLIEEGKWVVQSQSYTAQVRGGPSHCDVLFDEEWIDYPRAESFDVLFTLHPSALLRNYQHLKKNGVLFVDTTLMDGRAFSCSDPSSIPKGFPIEICRITRKIVGYPFSRDALEKFSSQVVANIIGLGALVKVTGLVEFDTLKEVISRTVKEKYIKLNLEAVEYGYSLFQKEYRVSAGKKRKRTIGFE